MATTFSSKLFNYDKETKTLTAEASTLQAHGDVDMEFWVKSERTGTKVLFEHNYSLRTNDEDREVYGWEYRPAPEFKDVQDIKLLVWND